MNVLPQRSSHVRDLGLVVGQRDGRRVVYSLYDDHVALLIDQAVNHLEHLRLGAANRPVRERTGSRVGG